MMDEEVYHVSEKVDLLLDSGEYQSGEVVEVDGDGLLSLEVDNKTISRVNKTRVIRPEKVTFVWNRILRTLESARSRGVRVGEVLLERLQGEFEPVQSLSDSLRVLEVGEKGIDPNVLTHVLRQKRLLDKRGEVVSRSKLLAHPDLYEFFQGVEINKATVSKTGVEMVESKENTGDRVRLSDLDKLFSVYEPVGPSNLVKLLNDLRKDGKTISPAERDTIKSFLAKEKCGPKSKCTKEQVIRLAESLGIISKSIYINHQIVSEQTHVVDTTEEALRDAIRKAKGAGVDVRDIFESLDENFDGVLPTIIFIQGLNKLNISCTSGTILEIVDRVVGKRKRDSVNGIPYKEFLATLAPNDWQLQRVTRGSEKALAVMEKLRAIFRQAIHDGVNIRDVFNGLDTNGDGTLNRKEFRSGLRKLGFDVSKEEVRTLMRLFEAEDSFEISYREFCAEIFEDNIPAQFKPAFDQLKKLLEEDYKRGVDWRGLFEALDEQSKGFAPLEKVIHVFENHMITTSISETELIALLKDQSMLNESNQVDYPKLLSVFLPDITLSSKHPTALNKRLVLRALDAFATTIKRGLAEGRTIDNWFLFFDPSRNGTVSRTTFEECLQQLNIEIDAEELHAFLERFGFQDPRHRQMHIRFTEFRNVLQKRMDLIEELKQHLYRSAQKGIHVRNSFERRDVDNTGKLTLEEFVQALEDIGVSAPVGDLSEVVKASFFSGESMDCIKYQKFLDEIFPTDAPSQGSQSLGTSNVLVLGSPLPLSPTPGTDVSMWQAQNAAEDSKCARAFESLRNTLQRAKEIRGISFKESFSFFDPAGSGLISKENFHSGLHQLGIHVSPETARALMGRFQPRPDGKITLQHFLQVLSNSTNSALDWKVKKNNLIESIRCVIQDASKRGVDYRESFEHFDKDFSGTIDFHEFRHGLARLGFTLEETEALALMEEFGCKNLDGQINYVNFLQLVGVEHERNATHRVIKRIQLALARLNATHHSIQAAKAAVSDTAFRKPADEDSSQSFSLWSTFSMLDLHNDGVISRTDFRDVLAQADLGLRESDFHTLLHFLDPSADGLVEYTKFTDLVEPPQRVHFLRQAARTLHSYVLKRKIDKRTILNPFQHFDVSSRGVVTRREFRCGLSALSFRLKADEVEALCDALDLAGDGGVFYHEFAKFVTPNSALARSLSRQGLEGLNGHDNNVGAPEVDALGAFNASDPVDALEADLQEFIAMAESMHIPLKETFRHFDKNSDGTVTWEEFHAAMLELGFECTENQLRDLMRRVKSSEQDQGQALLAIGYDRIDYHSFLKYWTDLKNGANRGGKPTAAAVDKRTEKDILLLVKRLKKELKTFLHDARKRGMNINDIFSHFDQNGDGKITVQEFESALKDLFSKDESIDERVVKKFVSQIDESKDGMVDYYEFLGMRSLLHREQREEELRRSTWQSVFGARRQQKEHMQAQSIAESIMLSIVREAERQIDTKGPIWQEARKKLAARVNNATFVRINKGRFAPGKKRKSFDSDGDSDEESEMASHKRGAEDAQPKKLSMKQLLRVAEKNYAAETAAARMAEEALLRAEEACVRQRLASIEDEAVRAGLASLGGVFFFMSKNRAVEFLHSIGLSRFQDRIAPTSLKGLGQCWAFPLNDDHGLQQALGSNSTVVARKVQRELLRILALPKEHHAELLNADADPEQWTVFEVSSFASLCGLENGSKVLEEFEIDGEALLDLSPEEAMRELALKDEIPIQLLLFRSAFLHSLARQRVKLSTLTVGGSASSASNVAQEPKAFFSLRVGNKSLPRPSDKPLSSWSVDDVAQLMIHLDIPDTEIRKLAVDGQSLLELTDEEIEKELCISGPQCERLRTAIEAARQPPWLSLGTGPYFEARIAAHQENNDLGLSVEDPVYQSYLKKCTFLETEREHQLWLHFGPALAKACDVARSALNKRAEKEDKQLLLHQKSKDGKKKNKKSLSFDEESIRDEEERIISFVSQAARSELPVFEILKAADKNAEGRLSWFDFEQALVKLGFFLPEPGLFRYVVQHRVDHLNEGYVQYEEFYRKCMNRAEHHAPCFDSKKSESGIAFTTDGSTAFLLTDPQAEEKDGKQMDTLDSARSAPSVNSKVMVRYGGGSQAYEATILSVRDAGIFEVEYLDSGDVEFVPRDWIEQTVAAQDVQGNNSLSRSQVQLALSDLTLEKGSHVWSTRIEALASEVAVGVQVQFGTNMKRFVGVSSRGELIFKGYSSRRQRIISRASRIIKKDGFKQGEVLTAQLDIDAQELRVFQTTCLDASKDVVSFDALTAKEEIARIRLGKIYKCPESEIIQEIKDFLVGYGDDIETILMSKVRGKGQRVPVSLVQRELLELGLEASETDLLDFLRPFMDEKKQGVDVLSLVEGLNVGDDKLWDSDDMDADSRFKTTQYAPCFALSGSGDSVKLLETRSTVLKSLANAQKIVVGSRVEVRFGGGSAFYKGTVKEVVPLESGETTFTVEYEDGDVETMVRVKNIRLLDEPEEKVTKPRAKLVLRVFSRLLAYNREDGDWTKGVNANKGMELRGSSFSNVGMVRLQELLRMRLDAPDKVNWSKTTNAQHLFFAPVAIDQEKAGEFKINMSAGEAKRNLNEEGWTLLGTIDFETMSRVATGEVGIPFTFRSSQASDGMYFRLCFMGLLGTLASDGTFSQFHAPVEPFKSVVESINPDGKMEFNVFASQSKHDEVSHTASRFFLLSGDIRMVERKEIALKVSKEETKIGMSAKTTTKRRNKRRNKVSRQPKGPSRTANLAENPFAEMSVDEKIVLTRWLASSKEGSTALLNMRVIKEGDQQTEYYMDVASRKVFFDSRAYMLHKFPDRPWMLFARMRGYLPSKKEERLVQEWLHETRETFPETLSDRETTFEALVRAFPERPWLKGPKTKKFLQPEPPQKKVSNIPLKQWGLQRREEGEQGRPPKINSKNQKDADTEREVEISQDEKLVIDRWLAVYGFDALLKVRRVVSERANEGEVLEDEESGIRFQSMYTYACWKFPKRPWLAFAEEKGYIASEREQRLIQRWLRKNKVEEPARFAPNQTLYEALVGLYPSKPWVTPTRPDSLSSSHSPRSIHKQKPREASAFKQMEFDRRAVEEKDKGKKQRYLRSGMGNKTVSVNPYHQGKTRRGSDPLSPVEKALDKDIEALRTKLASSFNDLDEGYGKLSAFWDEVRKSDDVSGEQTFVQSSEGTMAGKEKALAKANEEAQLEWERQEQLRRSQNILRLQESLAKQEAEIESLNMEIEEKKKRQDWVNRVSETYKVAPGEGEDKMMKNRKKGTVNTNDEDPSRTSSGSAWGSSVESFFKDLDQ